jgi:hypothetical protein
MALMGCDVRTDFLFAQPRATTGIGRLFDLWGTFDWYNFSSSPQEADANALKADWLMVGCDLRNAMVHANPRPAQGELFPVIANAE